VSVLFDTKENPLTGHAPELEVVLAAVGPEGPTGPTGPPGLPGAAATVQVGPTTTVPAGTPASVANSGTPEAAVLNFSIPQGPMGLPGASGPAGISNRGAWSSSTPYSPHDAVFHSASYWLATNANTNSEPSPSNTANWQLLAGGIVNRGVWNGSNAYAVNDAVTDNGAFWLVLQAIPANSPNSEPSGTNTSWQLLAAQGSAATVQVGTTSTAAAGTPASVTTPGPQVPLS
jgi:hypothetical protein